MYVTHPYTQRAMVFGGRAHILFVGGGRAFDDRFYCPLTLQLFVEPVLIEDGHHYEKHAIQKHFDTLGHYSPLTRQYVNPKIVILDLDFRSIIEDKISKVHNDDEEKRLDVISYYQNKKEIETSRVKESSPQKKTLADHLMSLPITPQNQPSVVNSNTRNIGNAPLRFGTNTS